MVIVQGDTNSTLAGALAASKLGVRLIHIESGCRSFNRHAPEEINRILVDHCADLLFTPDKITYENLLLEGIDSQRIRMVGDTSLDAVLRNKALVQKSRILEKLALLPGKYLHDMARTYSQSKIVFNKSLKGDLNMRVFEALSCGRLLLTDRINNGLEELFTDKEHLVIYNDYEDLRNKARDYLTHPDESEAIAHKGQEEIWKKHTYLHRARYLVETILKNS